MIILASQSPRRADLLSQVGIEFRMQPADIDERVYADEGAADYVERVALAKARAVHQLFPDMPVLGSDTAVVLDQQILGKPADRSDGMSMLRRLSGRTHEVLTGVALVAADAEGRAARGHQRRIASQHDITLVIPALHRTHRDRCAESPASQGCL